MRKISQKMEKEGRKRQYPKKMVLEQKIARQLKAIKS
jgi:hypothetical protein